MLLIDTREKLKNMTSECFSHASFKLIFKNGRRNKNLLSLKNDLNSLFFVN